MTKKTRLAIAYDPKELLAPFITQGHCCGPVIGIRTESPTDSGWEIYEEHDEDCIELNARLRELYTFPANDEGATP